MKGSPIEEGVRWGDGGGGEEGGGEVGGDVDVVWCEVCGIDDGL